MLLNSHKLTVILQKMSKDNFINTPSQLKRVMDIFELERNY